MSIFGFGLIYVIHGNAKDGDEVKIVNWHIKADCVVTLAQIKDRKARGWGFFPPILSEHSLSLIPTAI